MTGLTRQQARALDYIEDRMKGGVSPTWSEIAAAIGVRSKGSVHRILRGLKERGRVDWNPRMARSITLIAAGRAHHVLPPDSQARLERFCADHGERPDDVLADALELHFDALGWPARAGVAPEGLDR